MPNVEPSCEVPTERTLREAPRPDPLLLTADGWRPSAASRAPEPGHVNFFLAAGSVAVITMFSALVVYPERVAEFSGRWSQHVSDRGTSNHDPSHDDPRSDAELVEAANGGDAAAFEALYRRHHGWVARLAYRFTQDHQGSLDVMQEAFIYLLRKFPGFELRARLTTVLYPTVKHLARDWRRKTGRTQQMDVAMDARPAARESLSHADRDELDVVLARLSEAHRETLLMHYIDQMSVREIAAALNVPEGTVKSRLHHAIRQARLAVGAAAEKKLNRIEPRGRPLPFTSWSES